MVKVSIIVPVFNVDKYLSICLDSLIAQEFGDYEIICVNDCSTDNSYEILKKYKSKNKNIRIINNQKNEGLSYSRNIGIYESEGEYLIFIDSDDWLLDRSAIMTLYTKAQENSLELLRYRLDQDILTYCPDTWNKGKECFVNMMEHDSFRWESVRNFVRKDFLVKNKILFDEHIYGCEDVLFSTQCILKAQKCMEIDKAFYHYNQHEGSITKSKITSRNVYGCLRVLDCLYTIFCNEKEKKVRYSLLKLINTISRMGQNILWKLDENINLDGWEESIVELYNNVYRNGNLIINHEIFGHWEKIMNAQQIYLYGAGKASEELWQNLKKRVTVSGVVVTHNNGEELFCNTIPIYEISDERIHRDSLILLCITGKVPQYEVKKVLEKYQYTNTIIIGKEMI